MYIQLDEQMKFSRHLPTGNVEFSPDVFQPTATLTPEQIDQFRVRPLVPVAAPSYDKLTQGLRAAPPTLIGNDWCQAWEVYPLPAEDIESNRVAKAVQLRMDLRAEYERRTAQIADPYPPSERESWPVQISEARAMQDDPAAPTPWIDAAAAARGMDRSQLALRIVALDNAYRTIHGALTGARQRIEDDINAAAGNLAALSAIDVTEGWPE